MILIQEIRSLWTKQSRGGAAAAARNSVPEALPFPAHKRAPAPAPAVIHQLLVYGEMNNFAAPIKHEIARLPAGTLSIGCVQVKISPERLVVVYEYDEKCGGAPPRYSAPGVKLREELTVEPESWVRVRYNGRFVGNEWRYEKLVLNVGLFRVLDAGLFTSTELSAEVSQMAQLR